MIFTNKMRLPDVIANWLKVDLYDHDASEGTLSATTLLKPVQEIVLTERYKDKIEVDCSDRVWSLFGAGVHAVMEKSLASFYDPKDIQQEERLIVEIDGFKVSGKYDLILKSILNDFKVTSAYTLQYGSRVEEWIQQLSIYRYLYFKVKGVLLSENASIIAILRDWTEKNVGNRNYPNAPIKEINLKLMSIEETERIIKSKLEEIKKCRLLDDSMLPGCTEEERWINKKTGKAMKCSKYCNVKNFCKQIKD